MWNKQQKPKQQIDKKGNAQNLFVGEWNFCVKGLISLAHYQNTSIFDNQFMYINKFFSERIVSLAGFDVQ